VTVRPPAGGFGWRLGAALGLTLLVLAGLYWVLLGQVLATVPDPPPTPQSAPDGFIVDRAAAFASSSRSEDRRVIEADAAANADAVDRIQAFFDRREARQEARQEAAAPQPAPTSSDPPTTSTAPVSPNSPTDPDAVLASLPAPWDAVARCESGGRIGAVNPGGYYGLFQFSLSTWASVGGVGSPTEASASEQLYRAQKLYERDGASPWPVCGDYLG
jgi:hypothetical protein